ncbi:hypothetical protein ACH9EU_10680 [Kocuria sp. M1R5S2]|uniref:hypothetical protein n=1 Tax=Kocuria rhizosphaerae TaxID=3376285 RepID=UPI0037A516FF
MVVAGPSTAPRRAATLAAAVALAATGCSALSAAEPDVVAQEPGTVTKAPSGLTPGPYALTTEEGAVISFDLPTIPAPDDEVESLRRALDVEAVTYVELHIDNTRGARAVEIDDLKVISHEGGQFPFQPAAEVLADWDPDRSLEGGYWDADGTPLDPQEGAALDARTHALIAHYTGPVPAGAQGHELMIGDFEHLPATFDDVELSPYPHRRALVPEPVGHGPDRLQYRAHRPPPVPRDRAERVQGPGPVPQPPVAPAEPVAQPAAEPPAQPAAEPPAQPAAEPAGQPAAVPDCTDPASPAGPGEQAAWNAACVPVAVDPPTAGPAPAPSTGPTSQPAPSPSPAGGETIGTAGDLSGRPEDQDGGGPTAAPSPPAATTERRPRPTRSPTAPPARETVPEPSGEDPSVSVSEASDAAGDGTAGAVPPPRQEPSSLPSAEAGH